MIFPCIIKNSIIGNEAMDLGIIGSRVTLVRYPY
jgi:hypothetical protein